VNHHDIISIKSCTERNAQVNRQSYFPQMDLYCNDYKSRDEANYSIYERAQYFSIKKTSRHFQSNF
jgi:hypothetical protein